MSLQTKLKHRGVIQISGEDRVSFLQGLTSNDVMKVSQTKTIYSLILTPQGKFLFDVFIIDSDESLLLDCERAHVSDLLKILSLYKLRSKVALEDVSDQYGIFAVWGDGSLKTLKLEDVEGLTRRTGSIVAYTDPRYSGLGARLVTSKKGESIEGEVMPIEEYDLHRIKLGVPDGSKDMIPEKSIVLECGMDELNGVNWEKGCYLGQELTARTKYRALIKKRLLPIQIAGASSMPPLTPILNASGKEVGETRSSSKDWCLAQIRLNFMSDDLVAEGKPVTVHVPDWARLPTNEEA